MSRRPKETDRETRLYNDILVDAYGPEEHAISWYYYLDDKIGFPFLAKCITKRTTSPLQVDEQVKVLRLATETDCYKEMVVIVEWNNSKLGVPLSQLIAIDANDSATESVEDWRYWVERGYEF